MNVYRINAFYDSIKDLNTSQLLNELENYFSMIKANTPIDIHIVLKLYSLLDRLKELEKERG